MRHFIIDTDTASDDTVALVMALQHPDVFVEASRRRFLETLVAAVRGKR